MFMQSFRFWSFAVNTEVLHRRASSIDEKMMASVLKTEAIDAVWPLAPHK